MSEFKEKFLSILRNVDNAQNILQRIFHRKIPSKIKIMEVCGTHTVSIFKYGIRDLLAEKIEMISGPGCPVCVTPNEHIDLAMELAIQKDVIFATFGDMLRVPGSLKSLQELRADGADIRIVLSTIDVLKIANEERDKKIIFWGVGFETTSPTTAASIIAAKKLGLKNYFVMCSHKVMPPAMNTIVSEGEVNIDGFLCPGHVSTIIGANAYDFLAKKYNIPCVIAGFEPIDILLSIDMLLEQIEKKTASVLIQYNRSVNWQGNLEAQNVIDEVFEKRDDKWRGLGIIKESGLKLKNAYKTFDAQEIFDIQIRKTIDNPLCRCGDILKGIAKPIDCKLFRIICNPEKPMGPCMVSSEGTCSTWYKYKY